MPHPSRIKVSDLLLHVWASDDIIVDWFQTSLVQNLDETWISCVIHLQSIDNFTVIATLQNLVCSINDISDISSTPYKRSVYVDSFQAYFILASHDTGSYDEEDSPIFTIDEKNETIDVSEMIYQAILLQEPFVKRTPEEESLLDTNVRDDLDMFDDAQIWWSVTFSKW